MQRKNTGFYLGWLLAAGILLAPLPVTAVEIQTWSGPFSFNATSTAVSDNGQKLVVDKVATSGTMEIYVTPNGPPILNDGYYIRFLDSEKMPLAGINILQFISTEVSAIGKPDSFLMIGTGDFYQNGNVVGPAYVAIKGKAMKNSSGGMKAIKITTLTMGGGGLSSSRNHEIVWSGKDNITLTQQQQP